MSDAPVVGRLRRPGWRDPRLLVGLLLIAMSVTAVTGIVRSADQTTAYYAARDTIAPGTVLEEEDLVVVRVRVPEALYVEPGSEPWGQVVTRVVADGELVPIAALADATEFDGRPVAVETNLPLAEGITSGSLVDIYLTTTQDDVPLTELVASSLVVETVERDSGSFSTGSAETVYVVVPRGDIETFLSALAADGDISVVGMAGGSA